MEIGVTTGPGPGIKAQNIGVRKLLLLVSILKALLINLSSTWFVRKF